MFFGERPNSTAPHIRFVDAVWASNGCGNAGVVLLYDTITDEYKAYWGATRGYDEWDDICYLAEYGHQAPTDRLGMWFDMNQRPDNPFETIGGNNGS